MEEFEHLLVKQAPIEAYAEWFDSIVEEYVLKDEVCFSLFKRISGVRQNETTNFNMFPFQAKVNYTSDDLSRRSQTFLTSWSFITSRILQELTLKGAPTFGKGDTIRLYHRITEVQL